VRSTRPRMDQPDPDGVHAHRPIPVPGVVASGLPGAAGLRDCARQAYTGVPRGRHLHHQRKPASMPRVSRVMTLHRSVPPPVRVSGVPEGASGTGPASGRATWVDPPRTRNSGVDRDRQLRRRRVSGSAAWFFGLRVHHLDREGERTRRGRLAGDHTLSIELQSCGERRRPHARGTTCRAGYHLLPSSVALYVFLRVLV